MNGAPLASATDDGFLFKSAAFFANPYPLYRHLRAADPVHWSDQLRAWVFTKYDDVAAGLRDVRLSAVRGETFTGRLAPDILDELKPLRRFFSQWMLFSDPPFHTRIRGGLAPRLSPRSAEDMTPFVAETVRHLLDDLRRRPVTNLLEDFAVPLAVVVVAKVVGADPAHYDAVRKWSNAIVGYFLAGIPDAERARSAQVNLAELKDYVADLFSARRAQPQADLMSHLVALEHRGMLSEEEAQVTAASVLLDGHEPVANLTANGAMTFSRHPDQLRLVRDDPTLWAQAIDEVLRYEPPFQYAARRAATSLRIRNRDIAENDRVLLVLGAANRDPEQFHDPDRFDIRRRVERHCAFGFGPHFCVGASLGRLTAMTALRELFGGDHVPRVNAPVEWRHSPGLRGLRSLTVAWSRWERRALRP